MSTPEIKALHSIVLALPLNKRKALREELLLLQAHHKDSFNFFQGPCFASHPNAKQGSHWGFRPLNLTRTDDPEFFQRENYASIQNKFGFSSKQLSAFLRAGNGSFITCRPDRTLPTKDRINLIEYTISLP